MPRKGYKTITIREEAYEKFRQIYSKRRQEYIEKGVTSFSGFITSFISEMIEQEDKKHNQ